MASTSILLSSGRDLGESGGPPTHRGTDRSQFRLLAGDDPTPCRGEVGNQNAPGHAVDHEVVGDHEQSTRAIGALEPHHLHHDAVGRNQTIGSGVELGRGNDGEFGAVDGFDRDRVKDARSRDCSDRRHFLVPLPVRVLVEARTQHVVTIEHRCHRAFERLALDADRKLKQRCLCVTAEFGAAVQHPPHDRGERHRADSPTVEFFEHHGVAAENSDLRESGHGLALEDVAGSQHQPGGLGARDQLDRHDAVAAECEERIVDADGIEPENVREQTGQDRFDFGCGQTTFGDVCREVRCRECTAIEFAVGGQRQLVQDDQRCGHHVRGQRVAHEVENGRMVECATGLGHDVADQAITETVVADGDHGSRYPVVCQ